MTITTDAASTALTADQEALTARIFSGEYDAFVLSITPQDADLLLELNKNNRPARTRVYSQYAADMRDGRWLFAAEPVKFDTDGVLLDGQHRLLALASLKDQAPDISVQFMFVTGLDKTSQSVMDQGSKRTAGDNLGLSGLKNPNEIAAAARTYILWQEDRMFIDHTAAAARVNNTEVQDWVHSHPTFVQDCYTSVKVKKDIAMPARLYMALYAGFRTIDAAAADDFLALWATGANIGIGHPVLTLREKLSKLRRDRTQTSDRDLMAMTISAWNAYRNEKPLLRFSRPNGGVWTKANFPKPV